MTARLVTQTGLQLLCCHKCLLVSWLGVDCNSSTAEWEETSLIVTALDDIPPLRMCQDVVIFKC